MTLRELINSGRGRTGASAPSPCRRVLCGRFSFCSRFCKEFIFQPLADGQVVEFQGGISQADGEEEDADGYEDMHTQRCILVTLCPSMSGD